LWWTVTIFRHFYGNKLKYERNIASSCAKTLYKAKARLYLRRGAQICRSGVDAAAPTSSSAGEPSSGCTSVAPGSATAASAAAAVTVLASLVCLSAGAGLGASHRESPFHKPLPLGSRLHYTEINFRAIYSIKRNYVTKPCCCQDGTPNCCGFLLCAQNKIA
jgi:hypothetical protein